MNSYQPYQGTPQPYVNYKMPYTYPNYPVSGYQPNPQTNSSSVSYSEENVLPADFKHQGNVNVNMFPAMHSGPFYSMPQQELPMMNQPTQQPKTTPSHLTQQNITTSKNQTNQFTTPSANNAQVTATDLSGVQSNFKQPQQMYSTSQSKESFYTPTYGQTQPSYYPHNIQQQTSNFSNQRSSGQGYQ